MMRLASWVLRMTPAVSALGLCRAAAGSIAGAGGELPYRPFIDPLDLRGWWWVLLFPMALGVAVVYKAVRLHTLERYWRQVGLMTLQIVLGMVMLAAGSYGLVLVYVRFIAERMG